jgi:hypothetical protein
MERVQVQRCLDRDLVRHDRTRLRDYDS